MALCLRMPTRNTSSWPSTCLAQMGQGSPVWVARLFLNLCLVCECQRQFHPSPKPANLSYREDHNYLQLRVSLAHLSESALTVPHIFHLPLALRACGPLAMMLVGSAGLGFTFASLPWSHDWKQKPLQGSEVRPCSATVELKATRRQCLLIGHQSRFKVSLPGPVGVECEPSPMEPAFLSG